MKPRNKTAEIEMQGTRGLPSVSFIKQELPVIDRFIWWQESWLTLIDLYIDLKVLSYCVSNQFFSRIEVRKKIIYSLSINPLYFLKKVLKEFANL